MFNLGMGEITVILVLLLLFVGPAKLPELAAGLGKFIRQIRKTTADVKNEIVLDDQFRKPFEELRDAVTLSPEELKRRDQIKESLEAMRRQAEELERAVAAPVIDALPSPDGTSGAAPPANHTPVAAGAPPPPTSDTSWPPPPPPLPAPVPPVTPPVGTFPRSPTPAPLSPGRLGPGRVTPPFSALAGDAANITQTFTEDDLKAATKGRSGPPPLPPPLPGVPPPPPAPGMAPPPPPGAKKG